MDRKAKERLLCRAEKLAEAAGALTLDLNSYALGAGDITEQEFKKRVRELGHLLSDLKWEAIRLKTGGEEDA